MNAFFNFLTFHTPLFYLIQSVWRDEAFSYFMAKPNLLKIIAATAQDFNPPLYYLLLHLWMYMAGHSDIGLRLLSFIFHLIGVYFAYLIGRKVTDRKFAVFIFLFYLLNPMLLYYAFEMRMYSLYAMFTTLTLFYLISNNWKAYTVSAVLGLYSHTFFLLLPMSFAVYAYILKKARQEISLILRPLLFFIPWLPIVISQFIRSEESWLFPVDWQLIKSVLGNLFTGYEGTPWFLWKYTFYFSLFIIFCSFLSLRKKIKTALLFLIPLFLPLLLILGYSVVKRPVYVNRYLIFITVFEVFAVAYGIYAVRNKTFRFALAGILLSLVVFFNFYIVPFRKKTDFKSTFREINTNLKNSDFVYARTPIGFLESAYYSASEEKTFVYNPKDIAIPNYIGVNVIFKNVSKFTYPASPARTFLVADDASFEIIVSE